MTTEERRKNKHTYSTKETKAHLRVRSRWHTHTQNKNKTAAHTSVHVCGCVEGKKNRVSLLPMYEINKTHSNASRFHCMALSIKGDDPSKWSSERSSNATTSKPLKSEKKSSKAKLIK